MYKNNNVVNEYNRNRGSLGAVSVLLIFITITVMMISLCGCGQEDSELVLLEQNEELSEAKQKEESDENVETIVVSTPLNGSGNIIETTPDNNLTSGQAPQEVYVYVCGAVICPDVYELEPDMHVVDGIKAAGGFLEGADRDAINLAEKVADGMKIYVPLIGEEIDPSSLISGTSPDKVSNASEADNGQPGGTSNASSITGNQVLVNINTATKEQLMTLPGIGEGKAVKIIEYRENNGPFTQNSDIMNVNGIKDGAYSKIKDLICVG